ncbi:C-GCAxxG-C-C family protein [Selenomonas sp.]|uniref:C-GCAxxG-C-C family protein n=1 Tax=Selenomonas sp. TaxID=2053611 RepID=UPI002A760B1D|nr:C-GCAxxG-C-C family protein [Selenomonas sp.]MDY3297808.1 C-GCAxxG-C-C family protein [Selenomonas sp.]
MKFEERLEKARGLHERGYNCAQSVACAFADKTEVPADVLFAANEGYGAGQGTMDGVCGALMGAIMLGGLRSSTRNLAQPNSKPATMKLSRELMKAFEASAGALYCKDLKGVGTGKVICTCPDCIRKACELAEELVYGNGESI